MKTDLRSEPGAPGAVVGAPGRPLDSEVGTRQAVVRLLLAHSPLTAVELADRLGISAAGIRRHLDQLLADGAIEARDAHPAGRRGRGRPAKAYVLTEIGRARLPHGYDSLALDALEFLAATAGPQAIAEFARARAEQIVSGIGDQLAAAPDLSTRTELLAGALTEHGFSATTEQVGVGTQICQHHCPVAAVAAKFPQLCEQELAVLTGALGSYAQRLATIANGDAFCTTFVPIGAVRPATPGHAAATDDRSTARKEGSS